MVQRINGWPQITYKKFFLHFPKNTPSFVYLGTRVVWWKVHIVNFNWKLSTFIAMRDALSICFLNFCKSSHENYFQMVIWKLSWTKLIMHLILRCNLTSKTLGIFWYIQNDGRMNFDLHNCLHYSKNRRCAFMFRFLFDFSYKKCKKNRGIILPVVK